MGSGVTSSECQTSYNISEETVSQWLYTSADTVIITIILPIILCLGVTTNSSFLLVLYRVPKIRSETNIYLMHLALADLLYLSLSATLYIWSYRASLVAFHVPFVNSAECVSFYTVLNTAYFASIALVTKVSFGRFYATCHPMKHLNIRGKRRTYRLVAICWLVGLIFAASTLPGVAILYVLCLQWPDSDKYQGFPSTATIPGPVQPWVRYYTEPLLDVPLLIAMVANIYMYVRILQTLNKRSGKNIIRKRDKRAQQTRNQVAKMLIVNGLVFFLCQTPYRVLHLSSWICLLAQIPEPISASLGNAVPWVFVIPLYMNSVVNPLIYSAVSSQYRAAFIQAFYCKTDLKSKSHKKRPFAFKASQNRSATALTPTKNDDNETRL